VIDPVNRQTIVLPNHHRSRPRHKPHLESLEYWKQTVSYRVIWILITPGGEKFPRTKSPVSHAQLSPLPCLTSTHMPRQTLAAKLR
jgi:hypothetical protein